MDNLQRRARHHARRLPHNGWVEAQRKFQSIRNRNEYGSVTETAHSKLVTDLSTPIDAPFPNSTNTIQTQFAALQEMISVIQKGIARLESKTEAMMIQNQKTLDISAHNIEEIFKILQSAGLVDKKEEDDLVATLEQYLRNKLHTRRN